jgi:hypothetical protein
MHNGRKKKETSRGFVKIILLIIIGFIVLGYFGINVKDIFASPVVKENLAYAVHLAKELWNNWLHTPVMWVWDHILKFLWELFWNGLDDLRNGGGPQTLMQ